MDKNIILEGLKILSGEFLPKGWVFTSEDGQDREQCKKMVEWLNETETRKNLTHLEGGTYYGYATEMAKRIYKGINNILDTTVADVIIDKSQ